MTPLPLLGFLLIALAGGTPTAIAAPLVVPGAEKSPVPKHAEWQGAPAVKLTRTSSRASGCVATQVREWLRVRCPHRTFAISLLGGSNEGLAFWIGPEAEGQPGEAQFPLRRGDRRVIQLWEQGKADDGSAVPKPSLILQEQWLDGEPAPTLTLL